MAYTVEEITLSFIAEATGGEIVFGHDDTTINSISTDSRDSKNVSLFIALSGEKFDGNQFIPSAIDGGAKGYMSDGNCDFTECEFAIKVKDTRKALMDLASAYRDRFDINIVGLTGSVGKTTTKELVASVLQTDRNIIKTQGNFNNEIGLPLTLFGIRKDHEIGVIEMGMSNFGEISRLTKCAKPQVAIITNIGESHIEYLGSREGILKAKCEILDGLKEDGVVILNGDDPLLLSIKGTLPFKTIYYGMNNAACEVVAENVDIGNNGISFTVNGEKYSVNLVGEHNVLNALCAITVGKICGLTAENIRKGLASYESTGIRQSITEKDGITVITDCYNAAPTSVKAAIGVLTKIAKGRKIAVLGDMAELGEKAPKYHEETGRFALENGVDILVLTGKYAQYTASGAEGLKISICHNNESIEKYLKENLSPGDTVLFKGSRVMKLEEVANKFN